MKEPTQEEWKGQQGFELVSRRRQYAKNRKIFLLRTPAPGKHGFNIWREGSAAAEQTGETILYTPSTKERKEEPKTNEGSNFPGQKNAAPVSIWAHTRQKYYNVFSRRRLSFKKMRLLGRKKFSFRFDRGQPRERKEKVFLFPFLE